MAKKDFTKNSKKDYVANQCELLVPYNYSVCTAACLMIEKKKYLEEMLEEK